MNENEVKSSHSIHGSIFFMKYFAHNLVSVRTTTMNNWLFSLLLLSYFLFVFCY